MSAVKLYNYFRSSASWRVRIALNLKGIPYEYVPVNILTGEQKGDAYRAINPLGAVPTLEIDGVRLAESMAIFEYLEETRPEPPLLPKFPFERAQVRRMAEAFNAGTQPMQNLRTLARLGTQFGAEPKARAQWVAYFIGEVFQGVEALARASAGSCCFGDHVTIADIGLVPQMASARRYETDLTPFPTLLKIEQHLLTLPAFQQADPMQQPDATQ